MRQGSWQSDAPQKPPEACILAHVSITASVAQAVDKTQTVPGAQQLRWMTKKRRNTVFSEQLAREAGTNHWEVRASPRKASSCPPSPQML